MKKNAKKTGKRASKKDLSLDKIKRGTAVRGGVADPNLGDV